jgi:hypothetical protein
VILDEQWGIGGVRAAGDSVTAEFLSTFYRDRGFEVFEGAYSRERWTRYAIPDLMSLGRAHGVREAAAHFWIPRNPWFEWLAARGYQIRVVQTTHLDFCRAQGIAVAACRVLPATSIGNVGYLEGRWLVRAVRTTRLILNSRSYLHVRLRSRRDSPAWRTASVGRALRAVRDVRAEMTRQPSRGTAYVIHVLMPHRPIEVDSACQARFPRSDERWSRDSMSASDFASWRTAYAGQVRCVHRVLDELFRAADSATGGAGIVIVHGDHGARMNQGRGRLGQLEATQLNAVFSTLFAVRRPGVRPAMHRGAVPIQELFWTLVDSSFAGAASGAWRHFVRDRAERRSGDTLRLLEPGEMIWAGADARSP